MTLIYILIYIIGFFVTYWVIGPTHHGIEDDPAQRALALLWPFTVLFLIAELSVFIIVQINRLRK
jgi:hypothetical protein